VIGQRRWHRKSSGCGRELLRSVLDGAHNPGRRVAAASR
jgi:hypothetical protein